MTSDLNVWQLVLHASLVVQLVILVLILASLLSWTLIFDRARVLKRANRMADAFEERFWSGGDLADLYHALERERGGPQGLAAVFQAGFREFARLRKAGQSDPMFLIQGSQRSMRVALNREMDALEHHLPFLATVGSTSPYIGLFGTVWGIMHAFHSLSNVKQATLALVAPGISEALVATAIGLFAAIPAVVAYNRYSYFVEEFTSILQRQAHN